VLRLRDILSHHQRLYAKILRWHCTPRPPHDLPAVRRHDAAEGAKQTAPGLPPVHHPHQHHPQAPKISDELRNEALYVAESLRDKALMDNDYAASGYARDMEQEAIYAQARARLAREEKP